MSDVVIQVNDVSKLYQLGEVGTGTISHDLNRWWASMRGKEDPFSKVGQANDRTKIATENEHVWALKDINFDVKQGEVLGVIGKNGAGKSTLLKLLSRITAPTSGEIKIKGRVASLLEVGTGMHPEMTGVENVYLNGTILGMRKLEIKNKLEEILDFAGCLKYADTPVKRYSSGMKVRLGFAVAAFLEPEVLIVDEVLAVGDAEFQKKAIGKMQDITAGGGRTVLFVSHNMAAITNLCPNSILLSNGRLVSQGVSSDMVSHYISSRRPKLYLDLQRTDLERNKREMSIRSISVEGAGERLETGSKMIIHVDLENSENYNSGQFRLDIGINNVLSERICFLTNRIGPDLKNVNPSRISYIIPECNLLPGVYTITLYLEVQGEVSDWLKNVFDFEVMPGFFYQNKGLKIEMANRAKFYMNYTVDYQ